jgi:hypothetical protein
MLGESVAQGERGRTRQQRGIDLFLRGGFERSGRDFWIVENPDTRAVYEVDTARNRCTCRDFEMHGHIDGFLCKHAVAANLKAHWLKKNARELAGFFGGEAA